MENMKSLGEKSLDIKPLKNEKNKNYKYDIIHNNKGISNLLNENEKILKDNGIKTPFENIELNSDERIAIPEGYIRTKDYFIREYNLKKLYNKKTQNNLAFMLQYTDYINYLANRICIYGVINNIFYRNAIINIISILETMLIEYAKSLRNICGNCYRECNKRINKIDAQKSKKIFRKLIQLNILDLNKIEEETFEKLIELRNKIHIYLMETDAWHKEDFSIENYNKAINLMKKINTQLVKNGKIKYKEYEKCKYNTLNK